MTSVEAAAADYLQFRGIRNQLKNLTDAKLAEKFECSDSSIRKIRRGHRISTLSDEDHDLILALVAECEQMRAECYGKDLQGSCARHHIAKQTLINHLISIGEWEDGV